LTGGAYDLGVDAEDGSPAAAQAGVKSVEVFVDGTSQRGNGGYAEQVCPQDSCPLELEWSFERAQQGSGSKVIRVDVVDFAGNTFSESFSVTVSETPAGDPSGDDTPRSAAEHESGGSALSTIGLGPACSEIVNRYRSNHVESVAHASRGIDGFESTVRYTDGSYRVVYCDVIGKLVKAQHVGPVETPVGVRNLVVAQTTPVLGPNGAEEQTEYPAWPAPTNPAFIALWSEHGADTLAAVLPATPPTTP
jgi:hypothetical protein